MNSDTAKQLPFVITLNEIMFANEDNSITHQLCFLAQNADAMANWGSGPPPTPEGIILQMNFQKYVDVKQSILGSPLIFDVKGLGLDYFNIWQFGVKDAATYANAFIKFQKDSRKMMKNATFGLFKSWPCKGTTVRLARSDCMPLILYLRRLTQQSISKGRIRVMMYLKISVSS